MSRLYVCSCLLALAAVLHLATSDSEIDPPPAQLARLANGNTTAGRLEVWHSGEWGTVCDDNFDDIDAGVACYSLGFGHNGRVAGQKYGDGTGRVWLDDVNCTGSETSIGECIHAEWGATDCGHKEDVSIECVEDSADGAPALRTRLVDGTSSFGRLEVWNEGKWGTVCDNDFGDVDASVACYSLGFGYNGRVVKHKYGHATGKVWLDKVRCSGTETFLGECAHKEWGKTRCQHKQDVSIMCLKEPRQPTRLAGGTPAAGRLEIWHSGKWGTVCDDSFDDVDAQVACYSLGFGYHGRSTGFKYGPGVGQIWLAELKCTGNETFIGDCVHKPWGVNDCGHKEDVSIECFSP